MTLILMQMFEEDSLDTIYNGPFFRSGLSADASAMLGFSGSPSHKFDSFFSKEIVDFLFHKDGKMGEDLIAINIQRGRDHGIASKFGHYLLQSLDEYTTISQM